MAFGSLVKLLLGALRLLPSGYFKARSEAADQHLGKRAKLTTLHDLTLAQDFKALAADDRNAVAQFRAKMGIKPQQPCGDSDAIVADDMTINNSSRSNLLELILVAALSGGLGWWFSGQAKPQPQPPLREAPEWPGVPDTEYEVLFFDADGNRIDIPHISQKPKKDQ